MKQMFVRLLRCCQMCSYCQLGVILFPVRLTLPKSKFYTELSGCKSGIVQYFEIFPLILLLLTGSNLLTRWELRTKTDIRAYMETEHTPRECSSSGVKGLFWSHCTWFDDFVPPMFLMRAQRKQVLNNREHKWVVLVLLSNNECTIYKWCENGACLYRTGRWLAKLHCPVGTQFSKTRSTDESNWGFFSEDETLVLFCHKDPYK